LYDYIESKKKNNKITFTFYWDKDEYWKKREYTFKPV